MEEQIRESFSKPGPTGDSRLFINGAQAISMAAIEAGCNFFAGYPITPATEILLYMIRELPKVGGLAIQAEDEIASAGFCIGAALAGRRVLTATSGPGISLYSENIGLAIMGEVPMVIVDVQRMGPATGGATTVAQGDVQFLRWGTSGGYPVIVLSPTNVPDCYNLTMRAFDMAERFRTPVFLATDKETALSMTTVAAHELTNALVRERRVASASIDFTPYSSDDEFGVPAMTHYGDSHILRFTGSTHDENGHLTKIPEKVDKLNQRLAAKIDNYTEEICLTELDHMPGAETLIISYGAVSPSARKAVEKAREIGLPVSGLVLHTLWPVPEKQIKKAMQGVKRIVVPELNLGQYRREIERLSKDGLDIIGIHRIDGELITTEEIMIRGKLK
jgi:2-oxoglutarate/2-oxoacid ferredoxin oxidoreductase subunit alpha